LSFTLLGSFCNDVSIFAHMEESRLNKPTYLAQKGVSLMKRRGKLILLEVRMCSAFRLLRVKKVER